MAATSDEPMLLRSDREGITRLTLNRPAARNALSLALMRELQAELDRIRGDSGVRVVVIEGKGPAFCAGHDLKSSEAATTARSSKRCSPSAPRSCRASCGCRSR